jgi:cytoskeletal protein CcmA (bactofilin family)
MGRYKPVYGTSSITDMSEDKKNQKSSGPPAPELLTVQSDEPQATKESHLSKSISSSSKHPLRRNTYRPSHKATFIGLAVVALILAINGGVIAWVMNAQETAGAETNQESVTLSADTLDGLGVSRNPVGNLGAELTVGPNATFSGKVTMGSDLTVGGQFQLKGDFTANSANFAKLQAGDTAVQQLNVNGDTTTTNINVRTDLAVAGNTTLQGPVTMAQLLTVNNSLNVAGNVAVGGTLSARNFQANSLTSGTTLTIGGHIITNGNSPSVGRGGAVGNNGTVSISGNDAAGTIAVNAGTGAGNGLLAQVAFKNQYGNIPHVVISPVGKYAAVYVTRSIGGFSVYSAGSMGPGGYAFDYVIMQ